MYSIGPLYTISISRLSSPFIFYFFFFNDTATTEIYTLSLHDALPIYFFQGYLCSKPLPAQAFGEWVSDNRSEEHTSELQSQSNLVCRLLLEKKKKIRRFLRPMPAKGRPRCLRPFIPVSRLT